MVFFTSPEDGRWNEHWYAAEFSVASASTRTSYASRVAYSNRSLSETPTPERCVAAYHLHRTRFELITERKLRRRQLTDDGYVEISGRDLRERDHRPGRGLSLAAATR